MAWSALLGHATSARRGVDILTTGQAFIKLSVVSLAMAASASAAGAVRDQALRADLESLSRRTIFFGHQSVGGNILDGLRELAAQEEVSLRILEAPAPGGLASGSFVHALVPENGDPHRKLRSFEQAFATGLASGAGVAFLKFCYVDFHKDTNVSELFARYQRTLGDLEARFPRTAFVHVTAPLTTAEGGIKALAKDLLGRDTSEGQNARREEFNALMRHAYQSTGRLFDLALVEATGPDGQRRVFAWKGQGVAALTPAYTDDGGHLNAQGRRRVARALAAFLAALPPGAVQ
jgi:hypothetical protein